MHSGIVEIVLGTKNYSFKTLGNYLPLISGKTFTSTSEKDKTQNPPKLRFQLHGSLDQALCLHLPWPSWSFQIADKGQQERERKIEFVKHRLDLNHFLSPPSVGSLPTSAQPPPWYAPGMCNLSSDKNSLPVHFLVCYNSMDSWIHFLWLFTSTQQHALTYQIWNEF